MSSLTPFHSRAGPRNLANVHRAEITERTLAGESCKEIANALIARGLQISDKSVARRRVEWGLRMRAEKSTKGQPLAVPRPRKADTEVYSGAAERKAQITQLTQDGKSAEEIAQSLEDQGMVLRKGVSTIWRLQTAWKLIPPDPARAKGRGVYKKSTTAQPALKEKRKRGLSPPDPRSHYPSNCSHGPQRKSTHLTRESNAGALGEHSHSHDYDEDNHSPIQIDSGSESDDGMDDITYGGGDTTTIHRADPVHDATHQALVQQSSAPAQRTNTNEAFDRPRGIVPDMIRNLPAIVPSTDMMSAEMLVDLATNTLSAANHLRALVLALHMQSPAPKSMSGLPPTAHEVAAAKKKLREAAAVVMDLANV